MESGKLNSDQEEALWLIYAEAKALLRVISMYRSEVKTTAELLPELREHTGFIQLALEELKAPGLRPADGAGAILRWAVKRRVIHGALRQTINAHGPITTAWIGSAAKRIQGILFKRMTDYRRVAHPVRNRKRPLS